MSVRDVDGNMERVLYSSPCSMALDAVDRLCELPREVVKACGKHSLCDFRCSKQECCLCDRSEVAGV